MAENAPDTPGQGTSEESLAFHQLYAKYLTTPAALRTATVVHASVEGTAEEKMAAAILGAISTLIDPGPDLDLPADWEELSKGTLLQELAGQLDLPWSLSLDELHATVKSELERKTTMANPIRALTGT